MRQRSSLPPGPHYTATAARTQVQVWFQNRRQRERNNSRSSAEQLATSLDSVGSSSTDLTEPGEAWNDATLAHAISTSNNVLQSMPRSDGLSVPPGGGDMHAPYAYPLGVYGAPMGAVFLMGVWASHFNVQYFQ